MVVADNIVPLFQNDKINKVFFILFILVLSTSGSNMKIVKHGPPWRAEGWSL